MDNFEEYDKLKTKILKYVLYKKRTEAEIKLKFSELPLEQVEEVIEELKTNGYINDLEYIKRAVAEFKNLKNMSIKEIEYKLIAKGIKKNDIDEFICQNKEEMLEYEINSAKNIFTKKQNAMSTEEIEQYLRKKGYLSDTIKLAQE